MNRNFYASPDEILPVINDVITKAWGQEDIRLNKDYCIKIMTCKPGMQVSLHWHAVKKETFILIDGSLTIKTIDRTAKPTETKLTKRFDSFTLEPNVPHTFYTEEDRDAIFIEVSTVDESSDSYRILSSGPKG